MTHRIISVLLLVPMVLLFCFNTTYAVDPTTAPTEDSTILDIDDSIVQESSFGTNLRETYSLFRRIALPLAICTFSFCGFRILSSVFFGTQMDMAKTKRQILYIIVALIGVCLLPAIVASVKTMLPKPWTP